MAPRLIALAAALLSLAFPAQADTVADFYRGKTSTCLIGYGVGGGYDLFARTISRHMSKHIPGNPSIVPVNMPGASSLVLGNHLAKRAPQDGTVFGAVNSALLFESLFSGAASKAQFSGPEMTMIGNAVSSAGVLIALAYDRHQDARRSAYQTARHRRALAHRRHLSLAAIDQERARPRQSQDHHGLSRHARDRDRNRARRAQRASVGHGRHQGVAAAMARRQKHQYPGAARAEESARSPGGRAAGKGVRAGRGRPEGARRDLHEHDSRAPLHRTAEYSRPIGSPRCARLSWRR